MTWQPAPGQLLTRWAKEVTPDKVWMEYPRPQMRRKDWVNLNGLWDYSITKRTEGDEPQFEDQILVPFPIESALSGVKLRLKPDELLWYRRKFTFSKAWKGRRLLLHFGAVDWETKVFINNQMVGEHFGGYLPFWFDITETLVQGENEIRVCVWDPTDTYWQQRGKQALNPKTIWYTAVSGIWQTVWLEPVPPAFLSRLKITPDIDTGSVTVRVDMEGVVPGTPGMRVTIYDRGELVADQVASQPGGEVRLGISDPYLWSPDSPHLYDLVVLAGDDRVESYFGMRKFSIESGRLCLNNQPLFQFGPLDQGYWPDGLYTPPTDEAMRWDIELVKRLNCNMLRKHVKVEPARYYYHCDKIGLIVWQDMPNGGALVDEVRLALINLLGIKQNDSNHRRAGRSDEASRQDFRRELQEMVDHLQNFACIGMWVVFNEAWGQFEARAAADWLSEYDPTRPIDHASGWFDQAGGDCKSWHVYFRKLKTRKSNKNRAAILSEFGAFSLRVENHLWNPGAKFGYKTYASPGELTDAYQSLLESELKPWVVEELSGAVYTQTTDVEDEVNGYVTYDREVEKMDFEKVCATHQKLLGGI